MRTKRTVRNVFWACVGLGVCAGAFAIPALVSAASGDDDATITVKGEVVDLWCYLDHKGHGEKHKSCAVACVEAGNPIGIADASGHLYIAMGSKKHQSGSDVLIEHMADTVTVTGKLVKAGGLQAIYITSVGM